MVPAPGVMTALIPPGNAPLIANMSLVCALVSVTVADVTLLSSASVIDTVAGAIATGVALTV